MVIITTGEEMEAGIVREIKSEIRKDVLQRRNALSQNQRQRGELLLTERILGHQWFYGCDSFLCYVSYGSEICTRALLLEALHTGRKVYVPKVCKEREGEMEFYRITSLGELQEGYRGIPEPEGSSECYQYAPEIVGKTLLLMPGVAYDRYRNRIGYGAGYYDRYLAGKEGLQMRSIGVGFQCQLVEEIPAQETDIRPYQVICV